MSPNSVSTSIFILQSRSHKKLLSSFHILGMYSRIGKEMKRVALTVLDYAASVPDNFSGGVPPTTIPQVPVQLQVADLGIFLPQLTTSTAAGNVLLSADVGVQNVGPEFNNALQFHIYRDGQEIFNGQLGTQTVGALSNYFYNISFSTVDENVLPGFHVYQLNVSSIIGVPALSTVQLFGPVTFSGLGYTTS